MVLRLTWITELNGDVHFSVLDQKNPFLANLVQKIKIVTLNWHLVARLILICGIQWLCSLFLFFTINNFLGQIWSKNSKLIVQNEIYTKANLNMKKFIGGVYFICFRMEIATLFEQTWSKKLSVQAENWYSDEFEYEEFIGDIYFFCFQPEVFLSYFKIVSGSWNLEPRLIRICRIQW